MVRRMYGFVLGGLALGLMPMAWAGPQTFEYTLEQAPRGSAAAAQSAETLGTALKKAGQPDHLVEQAQSEAVAAGSKPYRTEGTITVDALEGTVRAVETFDVVSPRPIGSVQTSWQINAHGVAFSHKTTRVGGLDLTATLPPAVVVLLTGDAEAFDAALQSLPSHLALTVERDASGAVREARMTGLGRTFWTATRTGEEWTVVYPERATRPGTTIQIRPRDVVAQTIPASLEAGLVIDERVQPAVRYQWTGEILPMADAVALSQTRPGLHAGVWLGAGAMLIGVGVALLRRR